jgi:hypothetical protein
MNRQHGTYSTYTGGRTGIGCRCDQCREASAIYRQRRRNTGRQLTIPCWWCHRLFATEQGRICHDNAMHEHRAKR